MTAIPDQSSVSSRLARPGELLDEFLIDPAPIWPAEDGRLEPIFLPGALAAELAEFSPLDPERGGAEPDEPSPAPRQRASALSLLGSLGVHLPTLLVLISWSTAPAEVVGAIPMQLVIEESPSAPDAPQADQSASESASETAQAESAPAAAVAPSVQPPQPPQTEVADLTPPPKPSPPPLEHAPVALPAPARAEPAATAPEAAAIPAPRETRVPGADAAPGDYLDYLVTLTRGHFDILPLAFLNGRHGRTMLSVLVFEDGTISRIAVKHSSGYPDIDAKIEQMVAAVGRFPPVPTAFRKPSVELDFNMIFPDALQQ